MESNILNDPLKIQEVVRAIEGMERSLHSVDIVLSAIGSHLAKAEPEFKKSLAEVERGVERIKVGVRETTTEMTSSMTDVSQVMDDMLDLNISKWTQLQSLTSDFMDRMRNFTREMEAKPLIQLFSKGTNFANHMASGAESTISGLVGGLPFGFGALAQLALKGQSDKSRTEAMGYQMVAPFAQTGGSQDVLAKGGGVGWQARKYIDDFIASEADIKNVMNQLVAGGNSIKDVFGESGIAIDRFGKTAWETLLGLDRALQVPAGTMASVTSQIQRDTNMTLKESIATVEQLGAVAIKSGLDFSSFSSGISQVTTALRIQGGDTRDTILAFTNLRGAMQNSGYTQQRSGQLAMQATSEIAGMITSMSEGMKSTIGRMIAERHGIDLGPNADIAAIHAFNRGFEGRTGRGGERVQFELEAPQTVAEYFKSEKGGSMRGDPLMRALMQVGHMGPLMAQLYASGDPNLADPTLRAAASKEMEATKKNAHDVQQLQTGDYERAMKSLEMTFVAVGQLLAGLLGRLIATTIGLGMTTLRVMALLAQRDVSGAVDRIGSFAGDTETMWKSLGTEAQSIFGRQKTYLGNTKPLLNSMFQLDYLDKVWNGESAREKAAREAAKKKNSASLEEQKAIREAKSEGGRHSSLAPSGKTYATINGVEGEFVVESVVRWTPNRALARGTTPSIS